MPGRPSIELRLANIQVFRRGEQRAPHKPLYLLLLISNLQKGLPRLASFPEISEKLSAALKRYAPYSKSIHPEYPFWRLQNDNLATVVASMSLKSRKSNTDPTRKSLIASNAQGGLNEDDFCALSCDPDRQSSIIHKILDYNFPPSLHEDILTFFNLRLQGPHLKDHQTNSEFVTNVTRSYKSKCAVSGLAGTYLAAPAFVTAAHICWPQVGGNDSVENGISLTLLHQKLFHLGAFTIDSDYRLCVSPSLLLNRIEALKLGLINGERISLPESSCDFPDLTALAWHKKWVYKAA